MRGLSQVMIIKVVLAVLLVCASAYVSVTLPISENGIPFTAQSLAIFVVAGLFRPKVFLLIICAYLIAGVAGLPVFAEGSSGWAKITGGSGGFLYGFVFSGWVISYLLSQLDRVTLSRSVGVMLLGTLVLFVFGLGHLAVKFGLEKALEYGFYPFWKMALVKAVLAALILFSVMKFNKV